MVKIALDAGHGMYTAGKRTPDGMKEFEFNVKVAEYLKNELMKYEKVDVLFVHDPTGKKDIPLAKRTKKANDWKADLYLSLHANAFGNGGWNSAGGTETYIHPITPEKTKEIANIIHKEIIKATGLRNRGVKTANFQVLRGTNMSAVLIEHAFMTNKKEATLLKSDKFRKNCAKSHAVVIATYYKLKKKPESKPQKQNTDNLYKVQTGAFESKKNAQRLERVLKVKGFDTYIIKENSLYKVQIGAYSKKENALAMEKKLKKAGFNTYIPGVNSTSKSSEKPTIKIGNKVKIKKGAKTYKGTSLADYVYSRTYKVTQVKDNRVVVEYNGTVVAAMNIKDLILV